ncbi:MAG: hypothetical protein SAK42_05680 [Oscillatoria sp. PMC 1076.18]|nr:hypothetical protein [Oscillatoria sp. PMC 1076.18]
MEDRDHPPEETSFVTRIYPLTDNLSRRQSQIRKLAANGRTKPLARSRL